jgi:hypothetical protein
MRRIVATALIVLFALRSLLPAGVMLRFDTPDAPFDIVICTSNGAKVLANGAGDFGIPGEEDRSNADLCPFAMGGGLVGGRSAEPTIVAVVHAAAVQYRVAADLYRATPKPAGLSARGPPPALA